MPRRSFLRSVRQSVPTLLSASLLLGTLHCTPASSEPDGQSQCKEVAAEPAVLDPWRTVYSVVSDVTALAQHADDIWVGSSTGLALLDAKSGELRQRWTKNSEGARLDQAEQAFPDQHINSIYVTPHGDAWVATENGVARLARQEGGPYAVQRRYSAARGTASFQRLTALVPFGGTVAGIAADGASWQVNPRGLARYDAAGDSFVPVVLPEATANRELLDRKLTSMASDPNEPVLWIGINDYMKGSGLLGFNYKTDTLTLYDGKDFGIADLAIDRIVAGKSGLWLATAAELIFFKFQDRSMTVYTRANGSPYQGGSMVSVPGTDQLYLVGTDGELFLFDGTTFVAVKNSDSGVSGHARALFAGDTADGLFVFHSKLDTKTFVYGAPQLSRLALATRTVTATNYRFTEGGPPWSGSAVGDVVVDAQHLKWMTIDGKVMSFDGETWKSYKTSDGSPVSTIAVHGSAVDGTSQLWAGGFSGAYRLEGDMLIAQHLTAPDDIKGEWNSITGMAFDSHGTLWMSGISGLARYDGSALKVYTAKNTGTQLADGQALGSVYVQNDQVWTVENCGYLYRLDIATGALRVYADPVVEGRWICGHSIAGDGKDTVYVGGGNPNLLVTVKNGEIAGKIENTTGRPELLHYVNERGINVAPDGTAWLSTDAGLQYVRANAIAGADTVYDSGLVSNHLNRVAFEEIAGAWIAWIASDEGLQVYDARAPKPEPKRCP